MAVKLPQKFPGMTHATFVSSGNGTEVFSTNAPSGNRYFHFLVQLWALHFKEYTSKTPMDDFEVFNCAAEIPASLP